MCLDVNCTVEQIVFAAHRDLQSCTQY